MSYGSFTLSPSPAPAPAAPKRAAYPGSGRPAGYSPKEAERPLDALLDDPEVSEQTKRTIRAAEAKTSEIEWKAKNQELKYKIDSGEYLSRGAFREASATLLAEVASAIRNLPDLLERKASLTPEQAKLVEDTIDAAMYTLADGLEMFVEQPSGAGGSSDE